DRRPEAARARSAYFGAPADCGLSIRCVTGCDRGLRTRGGCRDRAMVAPARTRADTACGDRRARASAANRRRLSGAARRARTANRKRAALVCGRVRAGWIEARESRAHARDWLRR